MLENVKRLGVADLPALSQFYQEVCAQQVHDAYGPDWHWGVYPSAASLRQSLATSHVLAGYVGKRIAAVGVLTVGEDTDYRAVTWQVAAADNEIAVLHLFAVHADFRGQGVSSAMLQALLAHARENGQRVVHLDVVAGNVPAEKLYAANGFRLAEELILHYEDIGDTAAKMYECPL